VDVGWCIDDDVVVWYYLVLVVADSSAAKLVQLHPNHIRLIVVWKIVAT
jgi:hypothetical protein